MKWIGAALVLLSCGWYGFSVAARQKAEENALRNVLRSLHFMECELQYRLASLPELCREAGQESKGPVARVFTALGEELERQIAPNAAVCMDAALSKTRNVPPQAAAMLRDVGKSLGRFDLQGQLSALGDAGAHCKELLDKQLGNQEIRLRGYRTLGLCAGAALAVLLL